MRAIHVLLLLNVISKLCSAQSSDPSEPKPDTPGSSASRGLPGSPGSAPALPPGAPGGPPRDQPKGETAARGETPQGGVAPQASPFGTDPEPLTAETCDFIVQSCINGHVAPIQDEISTIKDQISELTTNMSSLSETLASHREKQQLINADIEAKLKDAEDRGTSLSTRVSEAVTSLREARETREAALVNSTRQLEEQRRKTAQMESEVLDLESRQAASSAALAALRQTVTSHQEDQTAVNQNILGHVRRQGAAINEINLDQSYRKFLPHDCSEYYARQYSRDGVYNIYVKHDENNEQQVYCDMSTAGGGWTVFQRRKDGSEDFYRNWDDYKHGFGDLEGEFWLGNALIANLTSSQVYSLRVDLVDWAGQTAFAQYDIFYMTEESKKYALVLGGYHGNAGDSMMPWHNHTAFSTKDRDYDYSRSNCAQRFKGGWWYNMCHAANLNGLYHEGGRHGSFADGVNWWSWRGYQYSLKTTEMKMRPRDFHVHRP